MHLENELKDMKHIVLNTEKRREDIFNEHNTLKEDYAYLETKLNEAETKCSNALLDRKDLLRLIDIMSSSPVAIKTVLEAYLSKLGNIYLSIIITETSSLIIRSMNVVNYNNR